MTIPKDIPIIFSAPMVRALLAGRKTMTRRLAWTNGERLSKGRNARVRWKKQSNWQRVKTDDRLWVRETHYRYGRWQKDGKTKTGRQRWRFKAIAKVPDNTGVHFLNDPPHEIATSRERVGWHKRPSLFMPRWASRLTLVVTETKIERLNDIPTQDAFAEGIWKTEEAFCPLYHSGACDREGEITALSAGTCFERLWGHLHGKDSWKANPEVVAMRFTVHQTNIDAMPKDEAA